MLMVCPVTHRAVSAPIRASGMFSTTTSTLRQSRRKTSTIRPVSAAPSKTLAADAPHGAGDVGRLVEDVAQMDVLAAATPASAAWPP